METQGNENVIMSSPDCHGASDMLFPASDSVEKLVHSLQTSGEQRLDEIETGPKNCLQEVWKLDTKELFQIVQVFVIQL